MTMRGGGRGGSRRRGALRGRQHVLLRRRGAGGTNVVTGGPVALDPIATNGSTTVGLTIVNVGSIGSVASTGIASVLTTLVKIGALQAATAGQSNAAVVLIDLESLSAIAQGSSSVGAQLNKVGIVSAATAGIAAAAATLAAIRTLGVATAGESDVTAQVGGSHITIDDAATSGSSSVSVAFENNGGSLPIFGGYARRPRKHRPDWMPAKRGSIARAFKVATSGSSSIAVQLTLVPPDPFDEELAFALLEAAA